MAAATGNIYFVGVSRVQGEGIVIAQYSTRDVDISGVNQVIEQPSMHLEPRKHYLFPVGSSSTWHLIQDDIGLIYILICNPEYSENGAYSCLEEVQRQFSQLVHSDKAMTARADGYTALCRETFGKIVAKFDNVKNVDQVAAVQRKVNAVKISMQENIELALSNCVKLENIEKQSEELQREAGVFKLRATDLKNQVYWQNIRLKLCIAFIILAILGVIIGVAVYMSDENEKQSKNS